MDKISLGNQFPTNSAKDTSAPLFQISYQYYLVKKRTNPSSRIQHIVKSFGRCSSRYTFIL